MTGLIVSHNEGHLIGDRLRELAFCDELLVVDVASTDDTAVVARANGARVIGHAFAPIVERVYPGVVDQAQHDLLVIPDPDEEIPPALAEQIAALAESLGAEVGMVIVPRRYHFRGRVLRGTVWGGLGGKPLVIRRSGTDFVPEVHRGLQLRPGYRFESIEFDGRNAIAHHWLSGYREFVEKHLRYLRFEGESRAFMGEITGFRALLGTPYRAFTESYVQRKGRLDGFDGLMLSILYALYRTASDVELIRELRRRGAKD